MNLPRSSSGQMEPPGRTRQDKIDLIDFDRLQKATELLSSFIIELWNR